MNIMNMELTGDGAYLMSWGRDALRPKEVLSVIHGAIGSATKEEAAALLISFSDKHNAWVGVAWPQLVAEMRKRYKAQWEFDGIKRAVETMIKDGLLEVPTRYKMRGFRWLNVFSPTIVCPTNLLINTIWTKQAH